MADFGLITSHERLKRARVHRTLQHTGIFTRLFRFGSKDFHA